MLHALSYQTCLSRLLFSFQIRKTASQRKAARRSHLSAARSKNPNALAERAALTFLEIVCAPQHAAFFAHNTRHAPLVKCVTWLLQLPIIFEPNKQNLNTYHNELKVFN
jgi:hypothetical protein